MRTGSVTAIYNRYGYVKEMRAVLEHWAKDLTTDKTKVPVLHQKALESARAVGVEEASLTERVPDSVNRTLPPTSGHTPKLQFDMSGNNSSGLGVSAADELSTCV